MQEIRFIWAPMDKPEVLMKHMQVLVVLGGGCSRVTPIHVAEYSDWSQRTVAR